MVEVILYGTGCPKCNVLKRKLAEKNIEFSEITDVDQMITLGLNSVPYLSIDGKLLDFADSVQWVNMQGVRV